VRGFEGMLPADALRKSVSQTSMSCPQKRPYLLLRQEFMKVFASISTVFAIPFFPLMVSHRLLMKAAASQKPSFSTLVLNNLQGTSIGWMVTALFTRD
jgi:hypothetical protein